MVYIENEGALFRGAARTVPTEVWNRMTGNWEFYQEARPKPIDWGHLIDEAEAQVIMFAGEPDFGTPYPREGGRRRPRGVPRAGAVRRATGVWV